MKIIILLVVYTVPAVLLMAKILKDDELDLPQIDWFLTVLTALCLAIIHNFAVLAYRHQKIIAAEKMDEYVRRQAEQGVHRSTWYLEFELGHHLNEKKKIFKLFTVIRRK